MPDITTKQPSNQPGDPGPLFGRPGRNTTSDIAAENVAPKVGSQKAEILRVLAEAGDGGLATFEVLDRLGRDMHCGIQRFSELVRDGLIEATGERRIRPETGNPCEVYRLRKVGPKPPDPALEAGYPETLTIDGAAFVRSPPNDDQTIPGFAYARAHGLSVIYRVVLAVCPGCKRPLKVITDTDSGQPKKKMICGTDGCRAVYSPHTVSSADRHGENLALVRKFL